MLSHHGGNFMSGAHLHLLLNHFPIAGLLFSILILALGLWRGNTGFIRAGLLISAISGVLALATYLTGEPAEKVIEHLPGFLENLVEEHEEAAWYAVWTMGFTGLASATALFLSVKKGRIPKPLMILVVILSLFTFTVIARTNYLGGQISHSEIR